MGLQNDLKKPIILFGIIIAFMAVLVCVSIVQKKEKESQQEEAVDSETVIADTRKPIETEAEAEENEQPGKLDPDGITLAYDGSMGKDYLQNCIFLGDSRIVGMALYGYIETNTALAQIGLNHNNARSITYSTSTGEIYTFDSYLVTHPSKVIYICYGVNGLTQNESRFKEDYQELVEHVKYLCPDSNIVIQSIWPSRDDGMYTATVSNEKIDYYNEFLYDLAAEEDCYYLDIQGALKDEEGQMMKQYDSGDGLHYNQNGYTDIIAYIVSHPVPGVTPESNGFKKETFVWKNTTGNGAIDSSSVQNKNNGVDNSVSDNQSGESLSDNFAEEGFNSGGSVSENGDFTDPDEVYSQETTAEGQGTSEQELAEPDIAEGDAEQDNASDESQDQDTPVQDTSNQNKEAAAQDTSDGILAGNDGVPEENEKLTDVFETEETVDGSGIMEPQ